MLRETLSSFQQFARETVAAVTTFLGGAVVLIGGILLDYLGWSVPTPYTTAGGILLMFWGMFWAYHKQRLRHVEESKEHAVTIASLEEKVRTLSTVEPEVDERLELEICRLKIRHHTKEDKQRWEVLNLEPTPDHILHVRVRTKTDIAGGNILVECDTPIFKIGVFWAKPGHEPVLSIDRIHRLPERVEVPILAKPLPAGSRLLLQLSVQAPVHLRRVAVVDG